jgi:hypothetical protein
VPAVGGGIHAVAREAACQELGERLAAEAVRREAVRAVRHRDDDVGPSSCLLAREQGRKYLHRGGQRPRREIGELDGRHRRRGVGEQPGPALVVEVVARAKLVPPAEAEPRDRAVDDCLGKIRRADPEPVGHAGAKALDHDVGLRAELSRAIDLRLQVDGDRLLPRVQGLVPGRCGHAHRIAARRLDPHDASAEP